jgi:adenine-specific DNA-methyltransferase
MSNLTHNDLKTKRAEDIYALFKRLGYQIEAEPYAYEGVELEGFEFAESDGANIKRVYIPAEHDGHTIYLYEVDDLRMIRLRGLAYDALQRSGSALLVVTRDYSEVIYAHPHFAGTPNKSNVRVDRLKVLTSHPTRHDVETLDTLHVHHKRTGLDLLQAQQNAFNVTRITKKFYDEYHGHYVLAREAVQTYNKGIADFHDETKLHAFTQRLLGRLMFLYFLQRKGWLGGQHDFLTALFRHTDRQHAGENPEGKETFYYYREVLEPLFFETMNKRRLNNVTIWGKALIPYLNGGLFDRARDPEGVIVLPDSLFDPYDADGLLNFFNRYNFTIADDTPLEQDVAVDPEMLGKVFENMLEERERGQSGSFYTPRAIVSYMCQEALIGHLHEEAGIPREITRAEFDPDDPITFDTEQARAAQQALDTLTVLDPAVGSGSFLIGMMNEIIHLRKACAAALDQPVTDAQIADWKEAIIRDTLYGVDIKPEAIEIAQLRLWLALIVNQTMEQARPLPNLDYKLMAGNSLIETIDGEPVLDPKQTVPDTMGWDHTNDQLKMFDANPMQARMALFEEQQVVRDEYAVLSELQSEFFDAVPDRRAELRIQITNQGRQIVQASLKDKVAQYQSQIDFYGQKAGLAKGKLSRANQKKLQQATERLTRITDLQAQMNNPEAALPFFLYRLHFSEVFNGRGGFDVVVANPPYVRMEEFKELKPELKAAYPQVYGGRADLYVYFFVRGFDLLHENGQFAFITSNKYLRAKYGEGLRGFLSQHVQLNTIIDFGDLPVFDAAAYPCIVMAEKRPPRDQTVAGLHVNAMTALNNLPDALTADAASFEQTRLNKDAWQITGSAIQHVLDKLRGQGQTLGEVVEGQFYRGIVTGLNEAFIIDEDTRASLIDVDPKSAEVIKPWLRGRDVKRWNITSPNLHIIFTYHGIDITYYPAIQAHLAPFKERLLERATSDNHKWYELQQPQMGCYAEFEKPKIVYPDIAERLSFTFDRSWHYLGNTMYFMPNDDPMLLGILNSLVVLFFYGQLSAQIRGGYFRAFSQYIKQIPVPDPPDALRQKIASAAQACLVAAEKSRDLAPLEARLNELVYEAYGLDDDDIAVIEESLQHR